MTDEINRPKRRGRPPGSPNKYPKVNAVRRSPPVNVKLSPDEHKRLKQVQQRTKKTLRAILVDGILQAENDADLDDIAPLV